MVWAVAGIVLSVLVCAAAAYAGRARNDFYSQEMYGMSARSHRRFAFLCLAFAAIFGLAAAWPLVPALPIFAVFALAVILYGTSFLRGYADEDS